MLKTRENCVKIYRFLAVGRVAEVMAALDCIRGARGFGVLYLNCEKLVKKRQNLLWRTRFYRWREAGSTWSELWAAI